MIRDAWIWCLTPVLYGVTLLWVLVIFMMYGPKITDKITADIMVMLKGYIK